MNFPEYTGTAQAPLATSGCKWDVFAEAMPFGSEERNMLHAERKICASDVDGATEVVGAIVVHVVVDYRTLPFITSQSPYIEVFRPPDSGAPREGTTATHVETVIYGWSADDMGPHCGRSPGAVRASLSRDPSGRRSPTAVRPPRIANDRKPSTRSTIARRRCSTTWCTSPTDDAPGSDLRPGPLATGIFTRLSRARPNRPPLRGSAPATAASFWRSCSPQ
jgi:hypothetical protein